MDMYSWTIIIHLGMCLAFTCAGIPYNIHICRCTSWPLMCWYTTCAGTPHVLVHLMCWYTSCADTPKHTSVFNTSSNIPCAYDKLAIINI